MYLLLLIIVAGAIPAQNHLGEWSVPVAKTPEDHVQLCPLGTKVGFFLFWPLKAMETFPIQQKNCNGHIHLLVVKQHMAYCALNVTMLYFVLDIMTMFTNLCSLI